MKAVTILIFTLLIDITVFARRSRPMRTATKAKLIQHIISQYPDQLGNPEKKKRKTFSQFGYGLSEFIVPTFPITKFIQRDRYGYQSYGRPNRALEKNGVLYSCRGGFIDFSHMRHGIDLAVYLSFKILDGGSALELPRDGAKLNLHFTGLNKLTKEDIVNMAQKIAFERLIWHELASWHYHPPNKLFSEQQSTFTPEDNYSDLLGTEIGKRVALSIMNDTSETLSYGQIAAVEIKKMLYLLEPVPSKRNSKMAYDMVDRCKQMKLPEAERNQDIWYDSKIVFRDQRYMFKRNLEVGPLLHPWLIPKAEEVGCPSRITSEILRVPQCTQSGTSFYQYYEFTIIPDSSLFYNRNNGKELHPPFGTFNTRQLNTVIDHVRKQMEVILLPGFDRRDQADPTPYYRDANRVWFK